jgi:zinc protease
MMSSAATASDITTFKLPYLPGDAIQHTFENGHTLVFVPRPGQVFNISTWVRTGSMNEDAQNNGVSHFLEHLMFKGTPRFPAGEFDKAMEGMGAMINAATWKDYTFYYVTGPNTEYNEFDTVVDMHADMMLHPLLPEDEIGEAYDPDKGETPAVKRERGVVIEEIGLYEDRPWSRVYNFVNDLMYNEDHPYRREVIGTRHIVGTIPRQAIQAYYSRWYTPQNMTTVVVGDFEFESLKVKVQKAFNFGERSDASDALATYQEPTPAEQFRGQISTVKRYTEVESEFSTRFAILGFHGPLAEDAKTTLALDIASHVLGESRASRYNQQLVETQTASKFTGISTAQYTLKHGNVWYIMANFSGKDTALALQEINTLLEGFVGEAPITEAEFARTVKKMKVEFAQSFETCSGIANAVGDALTVIGDVSPITGVLERLESITRDDVIAAAKQYLSPSLAYTAVMVPKHA